MNLPDIAEVIKIVCSKNIEALKWGHPEQWVQTEIFAEYCRLSNKIGWIPMNTEIPYITRYPVVVPKIRADRNWITQGAIKWIDLCLRSMEGNDWYWYELKVRHANWENINEQVRDAAFKARDAFRKDVVALVGFDMNTTSNMWNNPDWDVKAYWFDSYLKPYADKLQVSRHHFVSALLQLNGEMQEDIWNADTLLEQINQWKKTRCQTRGERFSISNNLKVSSQCIAQHYLITAEYST